jgi:hypothetical protein
MKWPLGFSTPKGMTPIAIGTAIPCCRTTACRHVTTKNKIINI